MQAHPIVDVALDAIERGDLGFAALEADLHSRDDVESATRALVDLAYVLRAEAPVAQRLLDVAATAADRVDDVVSARAASRRSAIGRAHERLFGTGRGLASVRRLGAAAPAGTASVAGLLLTRPIRVN